MSKPTEEQIIYDRNFHIHNDDRFLMEKITVTKIVHQGDDTQDLINFAREEAELNFKTRYPHIHDYLNFCEPKQIVRDEKVLFKPPNGNVYDGKEYVGNNDEAGQWAEPKKNAGTIEDQIKACKTEKELKSFDLIASMNPQLKEKFTAKLTELQKQSV